MPDEAEILEPEPPVIGVRGAEPGRRGCWALNSVGEPCAAAVRRGFDYCSAHSGLGVAAAPGEYGRLGLEARREKADRRAALRLVLGRTGVETARGALRMEAARRAQDIASRTIAAVLDPDLASDKAVRAALDVIEAVEPRAELTVSAALPADPAQVESMGLNELLAVARASGIALPEPD